MNQTLGKVFEGIAVHGSALEKLPASVMLY